MAEPPRSPLPTLEFSIQDFLLDREVRRLSPRTIEWHRHCLRRFAVFCAAAGAPSVETVTPRLFREFVAELQRTHNTGGVSSIYRSVRALLLWYENEYEPPGWKSPTRKVKVRHSPDEPLDPVSLEDVRALLAACERRTFNGERDRAILYMLLDTGIRRQEMVDLSIGDVNLADGSVLIRSGKGGKARTVFLGATARRAMLHYLRLRGAGDKSAPLWLTETGAPLLNEGLRSIVRRRAEAAGVAPPPLHSFRRAFAVGYLRNGGDVITLQRLLGHSTLAIITRYLKLVTEDLHAAHAAHGPVDRL